MFFQTVKRLFDIFIALLTMMIITPIVIIITLFDKKAFLALKTTTKIGKLGKYKNQRECGNATSLETLYLYTEFLNHDQEQ